MHQEFIKYLKAYKANDTLIEEGQCDTEFYCLLQGGVGIWKGDAEKPQQRVKIGEITEKGTYFGEMSALLEESRTASIIAMDDGVKVLKFPGEMLPQMILKQPKLGLKICTALANRLKGTTLKQKDIALQRNEIRDDATSQFLYARRQFQKVFIMLSAIQSQIQNPNVKILIEYMSLDKLQGRRKLRIDDEFLEDIPQQLVDPVKKAFNHILG